MDSSILIRVAKVEDAPALLEIYSYYIKNTAITFEWEVPTVEEFSNRIKNTLEQFPYFVAEKDGKIVGYAYAGKFKMRRAYDWCVESSIYIQKDCKKCGIGRMLLESLETALTKMGILNINACITKAEIPDEYSSDGSIKFHTKMGYSFVGEFHKCGYKFNRWYNMIWMEKMLGNHTENQPEIKRFSSVLPYLSEK